VDTKKLPAVLLALLLGVAAIDIFYSFLFFDIEASAPSPPYFISVLVRPCIYFCFGFFLTDRLPLPRSRGSALLFTGVVLALGLLYLALSLWCFPYSHRNGQAARMLITLVKSPAVFLLPGGLFGLGLGAPRDTKI